MITHTLIPHIKRPVYLEWKETPNPLLELDYTLLFVIGGLFSSGPRVGRAKQQTSSLPQMSSAALVVAYADGRNPGKKKYPHIKADKI